MTRSLLRASGALILAMTLLMSLPGIPAKAQVPVPADWTAEWPRTEFSRATVGLGEILSGGPPKDGIPAIDRPEFAPLSAVSGLSDREPVIGLAVAGEWRAYPLRILIWHEIVNDEVGGVPVAVTYCPLCNTALVFDRRVDGRVLDFGTTGKLRNSDLVMYDRQTESWWQQFLGEGIVGHYSGQRLAVIASRLESFARFRDRAPPTARVLVPSAPVRPYGTNPYVGYDSRSAPYPLFRGDLPGDIAPLARVVRVGTRAWSLDLLRRDRRIETADGLVLTWEPGQASAVDAPDIEAGSDVGNVVVQRSTPDGPHDVAYSIDFAFAFRAFHPDARIVAE